MTSDLLTRKIQGSHAVEIHEFIEEEKNDIRKKLLDWYKSNKREMPWRKEFNENQKYQRAYEVWVSEIMLQQTQVATVISYYNNWISKWPTIFDLANADMEEVNQVWAGLGYYSRAKRLLEGAKYVVEKLEGNLPTSAEELEKQIPGVGPYTAGAISSIAFNQPSALVDGNVIRVFSRLRAISNDPKEKALVQLIWKLTRQILDQETPGDFNQALMDLGATVCTPTNPNCKSCPISENCFAKLEIELLENPKLKRKLKEENECNVCKPFDYVDTKIDNYYPLKSKKVEKKNQESLLLIIEQKIEKKSHFLLIKRPKEGLLGGLWSFPYIDFDHITNINERNTVAEEYLKTLFPEISQKQYIKKNLGNYIHIFTHIRKTYHVESVVINSDINKVEHYNNFEWKWVSKSEIDQQSIPTGIRKAFKLLDSEKNTNKSIKDFFKSK